MAKIFRKTHNPYVLCTVTHSLTLKPFILKEGKHVDGLLTLTDTSGR